MGRLRRHNLPDGYFHVTARGVNGGEVFLVDLDRLDFIDLLERATKRHTVRLVARCLMDTDYHLIVEATTARLSAAMQQLNSAYANRFNRRHGRRVHVFCERFNPVKAGICVARDEWPWTRVELDQLRS